MTTDAYTSFHQDPLYQAALQHLQKGEWESGLTKMDSLTSRYPLDSELRALRQEMGLRAKIDEQEKEDRKAAAQRRVLRLGSRLTFILIGLAVAFLAAQAWGAALQLQIASAEKEYQRQKRQVELLTHFRDAQTWLQAGHPEEARAELEQISALDPTYPGLEAAFAQVEAMTVLEAQYLQAMQLVEAQAWPEAQAALEEIAGQDPDYKDVTVQLSNIERQAVTTNLLDQADQAFDASQWEQAASTYESIRALDPTFQEDYIQERLYSCYVQAAEYVLVNEPDLLKALGTAESFFARALVMRPLDPQIKAQRELARSYLKAQSDFADGRWSEVIAGLESVYDTDPEYALGTTRQTLYEAYIARGDSLLNAGKYEAAIADYQQAINYAQEAPEAALRLYQAHLKTAEAFTSQGQFESAVLNYRTAVDLGGLAQRDPVEFAALANELAQADKFATAGNFGVATDHYRKAIRLADVAQATVIHVVKEGEYLILIASQYNSTVSAIAAANGVDNPRLIYVGQELVIPVLR